MKTPNLYTNIITAIFLSVMISGYIHRLLLYVMVMLSSDVDAHVTWIGVSFIFRPMIAGILGAVIFLLLNSVYKDANKADNISYLIFAIVIGGSIILSWLYAMMEIRIGDYWP